MGLESFCKELILEKGIKGKPGSGELAVPASNTSTYMCTFLEPCF